MATSQSQGNAPSTPQSQPGASTNSQGAIVDSVNNGLRQMVTELGKLADSLVDVRKEQVQNYKAEKRRHEVLAGEITKIWKTPLRELDKSIRSTSDSTKRHTKTIDDDAKAIAASAAQTIKSLDARKQEQRAINEAERVAKMSKRRIEAQIAVRSRLLDRQNKELESASNQLRKLAEEVAANQTAGTPNAATSKQYVDARTKFEALNAKVAATGKSFNLYNAALTEKVGVLKRATNALKDFAKGVALGQMTKKLYEEAQSAKVTGNYASSAEFLGGQGRAASMGLGSQAFNEITASARASALTTTSMGEFYNVLESSTDRLQTITTSREESAKLSAQVLQGAATAGISAKVAATQMDALATNAMKLSKITGQSATEMMKLSIAVSEDRDHREIMLGLNETERANYIKKQSQDLLEYKQQGYSLEQAQELQKIALQTRAQSISERIGNQAKMQASGNVLANMYTGPAGAALQENIRQQNMLDAEGRKKMTGVERQELEVKKKATAAEFARLEAIAYAQQGLTEVGSGMRAEFLKQRESASGVGAPQSRMETAFNKQALDAKLNEPSQGGKGSPLDIATTLAGYGSAIANNTTALWALSAVMAVKTVADVGFGAADLLKGKSGKVARVVGGVTKGGSAALVAGRGAMLARGALGGIGGLVGGALGYGAEQLGGYGTTAGTSLNIMSNAAYGASLGGMLGPAGAAVGGLAGAGVGVYNYYNSPAAKLARQEKDAKEKVEKETAEQQKKQAEMAKDGGIRTSSTEDLQREFFMLAIEFYRNADPLADKESRDKHAAALHRLATNSGLDSAAFAGTPSPTGG